MHKNDGQENKEPAEIVVSSAENLPSELHPIATAIPPSGPDGSISWTASEFVAHRKGPLWYLLFGLALAVIAVLVWFTTKDKIAIGTVIAFALMFVITATMQPKELGYRVDRDGLQIGSKHFPFDSFRSFSIVQQGDFSSLVFMPMKRFSLLTTAYYDPQDRDKIVSIVSMYIPLEERKMDLFDSLLWRIHF